jgi:hypothetical protein
MTRLAFNFYIVLYGNNAMKQKTVHFSMACLVSVFIYNTAKQIFT